MSGKAIVSPDIINILVVEDSHVQAEALKHLLEEGGYRVAVAGNGLEAIETVREQNFTLIISDILMPVMDGYVFCKVVKSDPELKDIPVILLTELSDPNDIIRGLQSGADNFITKPYNDRYLLARIQHLLVNRELRKHGKGEIAIEIIFRGEKYTINSDRQQILDLLISVFETAVEKNNELLLANESQQTLIELMTKKNNELTCAHENMKELTSKLEERIKERTADRDKQIERHLVTIKALRESENNYKSLTERMTDILWTIDMEMRLTYITPSVERITGFTPAERMKQDLKKVMTPDSMNTVKKLLGDELEKEVNGAEPDRIISFELDLYKKDGSILTFDNSVNIIRDNNGKMTGFQGISRDITEWKKMRESLRESEERFRSIVETINDCIWEVDSNGRYTYSSPVITSMLGYEPREVTGKTPFDFMPSDEARKIGEIFGGIAANARPFTGLENTNIKKNGEKVVLETSGVPIFNSDGSLKGYRGVDRDITKRKEYEKIIQQSIQMEETLNLISKAFLSIQDETVYNEVLKTVLQATYSRYGFFGYFDEDNTMIVPSFTGEIWEKCRIENKTFRFPDNTWGESTWAQAIRRKHTVYSNAPLTHTPEGHLEIVNNISVPVINTGKVIGILSVSNREGDYTDYEIGLLEDIALYISPILNSRLERDRKEIERKAYEDELVHHRLHLEELVTSRTEDLKDERDRIAAIIRSVADGVIVTDINQRIIMMNHAAEEQFDVDFEKIHNQPLSIVIHEHTLREKLKHVMNKIQTEYEFDFTLHKERNGSDRIMHGKTAVIEDRDHNKMGTVSVISDVTHERKIDRMKTEFISTAAHELRTPLTSIQGFSEILLTRDTLTPDERKKYLTYINTQAVKLACIVGDLLDIARIESGKGFSINRENCKLKPILASVIPHFEGISLVHQFETDLTDTPATFFADKNLMEQVLKNLIANSVKYSPKGGIIKIRDREDGEFIRISVEDQGIGMTPDQVSKVFDKFYRADASDTAPEGTGLGMTIVKYIVETHGGKIWIESEYGKGTKVSFTVPLKGF